MFSNLKNWWVNTALPWLASKSPFGNPLIVQIILYAMVAVFFGAMLLKCGNAHAAELDIMGGSTVVRGPTGVMAMNVVFPRVVADYASISVGFDIIGESAWRCPDNTECNNNQAIVHAQVVAPLRYNFDLGIGVAHIQHADNYNSGSIDFSLSLEHPVWQRKYPDLFWRYQHFSCAGTCSPNEGRDMLLLGWRFR